MIIFILLFYCIRRFLTCVNDRTSSLSNTTPFTSRMVPFCQSELQPSHKKATTVRDASTMRGKRTVKGKTSCESDRCYTQKFQESAMQNTLKVQSWYFGASKCPVFPRPDSKQLFKHFLDTYMHPGIADGKIVHYNSVRQLLFTACTLLPNRSAGIASDWVFYDALLVAFLFKSLSFGSTLHDCKYTVNQSHVEARVFLFPRSCFFGFLASVAGRFPFVYLSIVYLLCYWIGITLLGMVRNATA